MLTDRKNRPEQSDMNALVEEKKIYQAPAILSELELEAQAGSPLSIDPYGLNPNQ